MPVTAREYFIPYRREILKVSVVAVIAAWLEAAALVVVVPLAKAVAEGKQQAGGDLGPVSAQLSVDQLLLVAVGCIVLAALSNVVLAVVRSGIVAAFEERERNEIIDLYMRASWPTQQAVRGGRLLQLSGFTNKASTILTALVTSIRSLLSVITFVAISMVIDWRAALAIVVTGTVLSLALRPLAHRVRDLSAELSGENIEYAQEMNDAATNARDLRVFGAAEIALARMQARSSSMTELKRRATVMSGIMAPAYQYAGLLLILVAILVASRARTIDIAALGAIALLLLRSLSYAQQLQTAYRTVLENLPFLDRLEEARATYRAGALPVGGSPLEAVHSLRLDGVTFSYDGAEDALHELDLTLRSGEVIGVVGPSGSGKSTLLQILLRLREPTAGRLLVNDTPASDYSLTSWYEQVAMVPQETHLFHATVRDNIAMFRPEVSDDEVIDAATKAGIHDVISSLPLGYATEVGPAFRDLSGGQVQRVGIARALCRGATVLVLDEPTSSLDVHSEGQIQETLTQLQGEMTLVIIAHRLSTLSICDRLVVLHDGRLEIAGPLAEVFEHNEFFRSALDAGALDLQAPGRPTSA